MTHDSKLQRLQNVRKRIQKVGRINHFCYTKRLKSKLLRLSRPKQCPINFKTTINFTSKQNTKKILQFGRFTLTAKKTPTCDGAILKCLPIGPQSGQ